jgi:type II secretory ATPase GspE/PulE/Tfp pilus assembly ATPase PilB-like protein
MPEVLAASVLFGGYVSLIKLVIFIIFFLGCLPVVKWINEDLQALKVKSPVWMIMVVSASVIGAIAWFMIPIFFVGLPLYLVIVGGVCLAYVRFRNSKVEDYEKVLTPNHLKSIIVSKEKKLDALKGFSFYTANKNEVPIPDLRTPEFTGYKAAFEMIKDATWRRASSILLTPAAQDCQVAYSIDGAITEQPSIVKNQADCLIHFVKNLADLDINEKRKPQKGSFKIHRHKETNLIEWEVATAGSTAGEQVRLTLITQSDKTKLSDLGLMPEQLEQMNKISQAKQGLIIISGSEKSGVTTSLYAMLRSRDAFLNNVTTIERQPSEKLPNIVQNVFSLTDTGTTTFAKKLQSILQSNPDIVGIAGCDDAATAQIACMAAMDGKLVILTLKANSVLEALNKWLKLVGDKKLASESLLGICNQRLVRKLCSDCKEGYTPDSEQIRKFNLSPDKTKVLYRAGKVIYDKRGKGTPCETCQGTGYVGRTAIFEIIIINSELAKVIQTLSIEDIGKHFRRARMLYLQEQALRKVINGTTTINEMIRVLQTKPKETK